MSTEILGYIVSKGMASDYEQVGDPTGTNETGGNERPMESSQNIEIIAH